MIHYDAVNYGAEYVLIKKYFLQQILRGFKKKNGIVHQGNARAQLFFLFSLLAMDNKHIHFNRTDDIPTYVDANFFEITKKIRGYDRKAADCWFQSQEGQGLIMADPDYSKNAYSFQPVMDDVEVKGSKSRSHIELNDNIFTAMIEKEVFERFYTNGEKNDIRMRKIVDTISVRHLKEYEKACHILEKNQIDKRSTSNGMYLVIQYGDSVLVAKELFDYLSNFAYSASADWNQREEIRRTLNIDCEEQDSIETCELFMIFYLLADVAKDRDGHPIYYDSYHFDEFNKLDFISHCGNRKKCDDAVNGLVQKGILIFEDRKLKFAPHIEGDGSTFISLKDDFYSFIIRRSIKDWLNKDVKDKAHISKEERAALDDKIYSIYRLPKFISEAATLNDCIHDEITYAMESENLTDVGSADFSELAALEAQRINLDARIDALKKKIHDD